MMKDRAYRAAIRHPRQSFRNFSRWNADREYVDTALAQRAYIDVALAQKAAEQSREDSMRDVFDRFHALSAERDRKFDILWNERLLCYEDNTENTEFDRHYIYHPAWAFRILMRTRPKSHADFSSTLAFATMVSAFVPVDFYDYRPAQVRLSGLRSRRADLTNLVEIPDDSLESVSCMHVIEHIGLGRYGDPLDPEGDLKAIRELIRVTKPGGDLLVVVPVGRSRIVFNAHRIYSHTEWMGYFPGLSLMEFALIPDGPAPDGMLINPAPEVVDSQSYGCGCYWFRKPEKQ